MSEFTPLAERLHANLCILRDFGQSFRVLAISGPRFSEEQRREHAKRLASVLDSFVLAINDPCSIPSALHEHQVLWHLQEKMGNSWNTFIKELPELKERLRSGHTVLGQRDLELLNVIGDAVDQEVAYLYARIGKQP